MGFLNKLGNAAGDFASFAVPAGLTLGANALLPGAGGIGTAAILSSLGAGAKGFAGNEQEERLRRMQLDQEKKQKMANLINQLSSKGGYQAQQAAVPKPGFLEQAASGVGTGIQAYQTAQQLAEAAKDQAARRALMGAQTDYYTSQNEKARQVSDLALGGVKEAQSVMQAGQETNRLGGLMDNQGSLLRSGAPSPPVFPHYIKAGIPMQQSLQSPAIQRGPEGFGRFSQGARDEQVTPSGPFESMGFDASQEARSAAQAAKEAARLQEIRDEYDRNLSNRNTQSLIDERNRPDEPESEGIGAYRPSAVALGDNIATLYGGALSEKDLKRQITARMSSFGARPDVVAVLTEDVIKSALEKNGALVEGRNTKISSALDAATQIAQSGSYESAYEDFMARAPIDITNEEEARAMSSLAASSRSVKLDAAQATKLAGIRSITRGLDRIERMIDSPTAQEAYGFLTDNLNELEQAIGNNTMSPKLVEMLTAVGFTAEQAVRTFSGAAVRDEEYNRFRDVFIGSLKGGPKQARASIKSFRSGLEDLQIEIASVAMQSRAGNLLFGLSDRRIAELIGSGEGGMAEMATEIGVSRGIIPKVDPSQIVRTMGTFGTTPPQIFAPRR
jgi:hypothetical protein